MEIRSALAASNYLKARPATRPEPQTIGAPQAVRRAVEDFATTVVNGETTAKAALAGKADPQALVEALAQTQLAVETAVTLRDKVAEAYQEILRMPI